MDAEDEKRILQLASEAGTSRNKDVADDLEGTECRLEGDHASKSCSDGQANGESVISIERSNNSPDDDSSRHTKSKQNNSNRSTPDGESLTENVTKLDKLKFKMKKRNYRTTKSSSGPSDSETSDDDTELRPNEDDTNEWTMDSEEEVDKQVEEGTPACLRKEKPKPKWFVVPELFSRQIGNNPLFRQRYHGSLHVVERFELMHKIEDGLHFVDTISFNRKGNFLASCANSRTVDVWDWAVGKMKNAFSGDESGVIVLAKWLPLDEEYYIVTCAHDNQVRLLDLRRGTSLHLASLTIRPSMFAVHPNTPHVVMSVDNDARVLSIDVREKKPTELVDVRNGFVKVTLHTVDIHPFNSNEFCVGGSSEIVRIYDRRRLNTPLYKLCPSHMTSDTYVFVTCAVYNYNGTEILATYNDEDIYLFDTVTSQVGDYAHRYQGHRNSITMKKSVNFFGPKSEYIVSGSDCGNIFIWDKDTEAIVNIITSDDDKAVNYVEPHPHIPILATSGDTHNIKIWKPSCKSPPDMTKFESCVKTNASNRASSPFSNEIDSQFSWMLHYTLVGRRRSAISALATRTTDDGLL